MARWTAFEGTTTDSTGKIERFELFLDAHKIKVIKRRGKSISIYMEDDIVETIEFTSEDDLNNTFFKLAEAIEL